MSTKLKLKLREGNNESVILYATTNGAPRNITGRTLEVYIKIDANQDDAESNRLASDNGYIDITDGPGGVAELNVPGSVLTPDKTFWRFDVIDGNTRKTHVYGPLEVANI